MKRFLQFIILCFITILFTSCATKYQDLPTTSKVDLNRYLGTWYEIARFEHFFEKGCKNVTANYTLKDNGDINVINRCIKIETGKETKAKGIAYSINETNTKLKVSFFRPFWGDYWILDLDDDYSYALIGTPSREYLWILARKPQIDDKLKKELLLKITSLGFDINKIIWTIQD